MKKYKVIRIKTETYKKLMEKQVKMNVVYKQITGRNKKIPLMRVVDITASNPLYLGDDDLVRRFKRKL